MTQPGREVLETLVNSGELYQNAPCGYLTMLPEGNIININNTLLEWLGFSKEEMTQKRFSDLLSRGGKIHYEMFFLPMMKLSGFVKELSYELMSRGGTLFPALLNGNIIKDRNGKVVAFNIAVTDITHRRQYEKQLIIARKTAEAEKKRFELIADLSPEIIWSSDAEGQLDYINPFFRKYFHVSVNEVFGAAMLLRIHAGDRRQFIRSWIHARQRGGDIEFNCRLQNANENNFEWFRIKIISYRNDGDNTTRIVGWCRNIHDHVMAMQRKDEFIHIASHELNNPVTVLKAYLQVMEMSELDDMLQSLVRKGLASVKKLQFLISSLLDMAVIDSGTLALNVSRFSLTALVKECIEQILSSKKIEHEIVLKEAEENFYVRADKDRIYQVVINLVTNAVKYSPGQNLVEVELRKEEGTNSVRLSVRDYGVGIPASQHALIFNKYYRISETSRQTGASGLGLGLYITNNIISAHNSKLFVESKPGEGSTFYFSLPGAD